MPKKNNSQEYWAKRRQQDKIKVINTGENGINNLKRLLKLNIDDVEKQITDFFEKYAEKPSENLSQKELLAYKKKLKDAVKKVPNDKILKKLLVEDAPKYKIDRLRALQTEIQLTLTEATVGQEKGIYSTLDDVAKVSQKVLSKSMKEAIGLEFNTIGAKKLKQILSSDWSGATWSDRLWKDRELVGNKITNILERGMVQGTSLQTMSRELKQATGQSFNNAFRLIRTETSHIDGQVTLEGYKQAGKELGLEYYEYDAFLDSRTSDICRELDKKRFKVSEAEVGVNYPPLHPSCRSTTQLVLDEEYKQEESRSENPNNSKEEVKEETEKQQKPNKKKEETVLVKEGVQKKGSTIPNDKQNEFIKAKNYKDAEKYAEKLGIKKADYKGLDIETANSMNKVYSEYSKKYPEIIQKMEYTGSHDNLYKYMKNNVITDDYAAQWLKKKYPQFSDAKIKLYTPTVKKELIKSFKPSKTARATSRVGDLGNIITFNSNETHNETAKNKGLEILHKFKPRGTASVEGSIHHELGHQMDNLLNLRENKQIQDIYNELSKNEITENLSKYAWDNSNKNKYSEFIAEAWSEYKTSKKPRKIAKDVGEIIEKEYAKYKN